MCPRYEVCDTPEGDHFALWDRLEQRRVYNPEYPGYWILHRDAAAACEALNLEHERSKPGFI